VAKGCALIDTILDRDLPKTGRDLCCGVAAGGGAQATAAELADLRQRLVAAWAGAVSAPLLRHADDQTVVALAAVHAARERMTSGSRRFSDWGTLAAPRFLGRAAFAATLERTKVDGPWNVSAHLVPHRSLHSPAGMLSMALGSRGPNLGVGGGPGGELDVVLTAATLLHAENLPGVWAIMTAWEPEAIPDVRGVVPPASVCRAVALALSARDSSSMTLHVHVGSPKMPARVRRTNREHGNRGFTLESLAAAVTSSPECPSTWVWHDEGATIELCWRGTTEPSTERVVERGKWNEGPR